RPVILRQLDGTLVAEKVGGVEEIDVEGVTLDPLPAVEEAAQGAELTADLDTAGGFDRVDGAHLVGNGADAADAGGDVRRLGVLTTAQEGFEESGRFEDAQFHVDDAVVADGDVERAFAFDAGQIVDPNRALPVRHGPDSPRGRV